MPSLASTFFASALEGTLRAALATDEATRAELAALAPKALAVDVASSPAQFTLVFTPQGLQIEAGTEGEADARLSVTPRALVDLLAGERERALMSGEVRIDGDTELAMQSFTVLARLRPDLEGPLARLIGETPAAAVGSAARQGGHLARQATLGAAGTARELLTAADGPLPSKPEVARLLDDIDELRMAADRIAARLNGIERKLDEGDEAGGSSAGSPGGGMSDRGMPDPGTPAPGMPDPGTPDRS